MYNSVKNSWRWVIFRIKKHVQYKCLNFSLHSNRLSKKNTFAQSKSSDLKVCAETWVNDDIKICNFVFVFVLYSSKGNFFTKFYDQRRDGRTVQQLDF